MVSFNPTLVRLRRCKTWVPYRSLKSFNPTLVRLRRPRRAATASRRPSFNPTLVRLRPMRGFFCWPNSSRVSIPRWFD